MKSFITLTIFISQLVSESAPSCISIDLGNSTSHTVEHDKRSSIIDATVKGKMDGLTVMKLTPGVVWSKGTADFNRAHQSFSSLRNNTYPTKLSYRRDNRVYTEVKTYEGYFWEGSKNITKHHYCAEDEICTIEVTQSKKEYGWKVIYSNLSLLNNPIIQLPIGHHTLGITRNPNNKPYPKFYLTFFGPDTKFIWFNRLFWLIEGHSSYYPVSSRMWPHTEHKFQKQSCIEFSSGGMDGILGSSSVKEL